MTNDILESIKNYCKIINKRRLIKSAKRGMKHLTMKIEGEAVWKRKNYQKGIAIALSMMLAVTVLPTGFECQKYRQQAKCCMWEIYGGNRGKRIGCS